MRYQNRKNVFSVGLMIIFFGCMVSTSAFIDTNKYR